MELSWGCQRPVAQTHRILYHNPVVLGRGFLLVWGKGHGIGIIPILHRPVMGSDTVPFTLYLGVYSQSIGVGAGLAEVSSFLLGVKLDLFRGIGGAMAW